MISTKRNRLGWLLQTGAEQIEHTDPVLYAVLQREWQRQQESLVLVAASSITPPSVLACEGSFASNVTAEGVPGNRFHGGCEYIDQIEQLAIDRAKQAFGADYAFVQPHTATTANQIVTTTLLQAGDTLLGMDLRAGGHLTHGAPVNFSGQYFNAATYGLTKDGFIDYKQVDQLATQLNPKLIICGTTAYPRTIDFRRFREIADRVGAYLLADVTHIAGLIIAGLHPSSIDHAHITTTCTHKQLYGPRGGLILLGRDGEKCTIGTSKKLHEVIQRGVFPFFQGAPILNSIAAKAHALAITQTAAFNNLAAKILSLAQALAHEIQTRGVPVVSGGTDNHIVLLDVHTHFGVSGDGAQDVLEACGIIVNKNSVPNDTRPAHKPSGIRLGSNSIAARGYTTGDMKVCADLLIDVLAHTTRRDGVYATETHIMNSVKETVLNLCSQHPIPAYKA